MEAEKKNHHQKGKRIKTTPQQQQGGIIGEKRGRGGDYYILYPGGAERTVRTQSSPKN